MSNTSNASKNVKRFLLLFALGIAYGFMYVMPYMKSSFYDQMIAAMGCTNAQLGSLMTAYCICCTVSYLPGGWIGDKFNPKPVLLISIFGQAALSFLFMFTYGQRPLLRQRRVRQGQVHPQRRQRLSHFPACFRWAANFQFLFFHPSFCSVLRFYRTNLLSYQPSSGFPIFPCSRPVSGAGTGLKTGTCRAPRQVPGAFLRLTGPRQNSKIKRAGGGPPEKENVF